MYNGGTGQEIQAGYETMWVVMSRGSESGDTGIERNWHAVEISASYIYGCYSMSSSVVCRLGKVKATVDRSAGVSQMLLDQPADIRNHRRD